MKKLIVVADDFGFTSGINKGCLETYQSGILTEMSLMLDSPATVEGVRVALDNNIEGLGIHITLNDIVGTGKYFRTDDYKKLLEESTAEKLSARVEDELKRFEDLVGRIPTHINGHKNCHLHPKIVKVISDYAVKNKIYVRRSWAFSDGNSAGEDVNQELIDNGVMITDYIFERIVGSYDEAYAGFLHDLSSIEENTTTEIFFHPAYVDAQLKSYSSLLYDRERDIKLLTDKSFKKELEKLGFQISGFN